MLTLLIVLIGLMAGVYFAFSVFVMKALGALPEQEGALAMDRINEVILNSLFLPIFFGTSLGMTGLALWSAIHWQPGYSSLLICAAVIYVSGMFGVTAFGNVPLNNRLKQSVRTSLHQESEAPDPTTTWRDYQVRWIRLNHIRTLSSLVACGLLVIAISSGG